MGTVTRGIPRAALRLLLKRGLLADGHVALCELVESAEVKRDFGNDLKLKLEEQELRLKEREVKLDHGGVRFRNDPFMKCPTILRSPLRLPEVLSPPPLAHLNLTDKSKSVAWSHETPKPSNWQLAASIFQRNSNAPIEDRAVVSLLPISKSFIDDPPASTQTPWFGAAVIDGHSGWQTAEFVSRHLFFRVQSAINAAEGFLTPANVSKILCTVFTKLDDEIRRRIDPAFNIGHCSVAKAGATTCCALVTPTKILVANLGDCRAVLCRGSSALILTDDHNARSPTEAEKLRALHPNEPDIVEFHPEKKEAPQDAAVQKGWWDCLRSMYSSADKPDGAYYTKGRLQLTRSFGDFYLKDPKYAVDWSAGKLNVAEPHSFPYVTVAPEVTVISRDTANDRFLLLASDGVWDFIEPEEAVSFILQQGDRPYEPACLRAAEEGDAEKLKLRGRGGGSLPDNSRACGLVKISDRPQDLSSQPGNKSAEGWRNRQGEKIGIPAELSVPSESGKCDLAEGECERLSGAYDGKKADGPSESLFSIFGSAASFLSGVFPFSQVCPADCGNPGGECNLDEKRVRVMAPPATVPQKPALRGDNGARTSYCDWLRRTDWAHSFLSLKGAYDGKKNLKVIAENLEKRILEKILEKNKGLKLEEILRMEAKIRRQYFDDITIVLVDLTADQ